MPTNKRLKVDNRQKTLTQTGFLSKGNIEEPTKKGDDAHTTETNQPTDTETNEHKKICKFNPSWLQLYSWLAFDGDGQYMYCTLCTNGKKVNGMMKGAKCTNFQKTTLDRHV